MYEWMQKTLLKKTIPSFNIHQQSAHTRGAKLFSAFAFFHHIYTVIGENPVAKSNSYKMWHFHSYEKMLYKSFTIAKSMCMYVAYVCLFFHSRITNELWTPWIWFCTLSSWKMKRKKFRWEVSTFFSTIHRILLTFFLYLCYFVIFFYRQRTFKSYSWFRCNGH